MILTPMKTLQMQLFRISLMCFGVVGSGGILVYRRGDFLSFCVEGYLSLCGVNILNPLWFLGLVGPFSLPLLV